MNIQSDVAPEFSLRSRIVVAAAIPPDQSFYWSIRRELWENRSIYIAPIAVAGVLLLGFSIASIGYAVSTPDHTRRAAALTEPQDFAATLLMLTQFLVGAFYCLDALHGERRDRSILFWKSLPVSDVTTVLSKVSIPLLVLPLLTFAIIISTQLIMLELSTVVFLMSGMSVASLWTRLPQMELVMLYALGVHALWHAPIYSWLLLVSGWARRAAILWAVLPLFVIGIFEHFSLHTSNFLRYILIGGCMRAFDLMDSGKFTSLPLTQLTPGRFLGSAGLWIGLLVAAGLLAAAVRLRRSRQPI